VAAKHGQQAVTPQDFPQGNNPKLDQPDPPPVDNSDIWEYVLRNRGTVHIESLESNDSNPWGSLASFVSQADSDLEAEPEDLGDLEAQVASTATYGLSTNVLLSQDFAVKAARNGTLFCLDLK
jgi:hypothetical protein